MHHFQYGFFRFKIFFSLYFTLYLQHKFPKIIYYKLAHQIELFEIKLVNLDKNKIFYQILKNLEYYNLKLFKFSKPNLQLLHLKLVKLKEITYKLHMYFYLVQLKISKHHNYTIILILFLFLHELLNLLLIRIFVP